MKKNTCCILLFVSLLSMRLCAQSDVSQARWQTTKVVTDGHNNEWRKPLNLYDAITGLLFTIANDSTNLYLCFTANDERKVTKLMKAGWSVEIFSKEKNKKFDASIAFPAVQMISAPGKDEGVAKIESVEFKNETALYRLNVQTVKTTGFVTANAANLPILNNNGINIGLGSDSVQAIIFELAVPLKELLPGNSILLNEEMEMNITVNKLKRPAYRGDPDGKDLVGKGKGGRNHGASDNSEYTVDRSYLFTEINFKQKFKLAAK
ncbi:MAG: hypothetical protein ABJB86_14990 [Bacteroidota bacterium]